MTLARCRGNFVQGIPYPCVLMSRTQFTEEATPPDEAGRILRIVYNLSRHRAVPMFCTWENVLFSVCIRAINEGLAIDERGHPEEML